MLRDSRTTSVTFLLLLATLIGCKTQQLGSSALAATNTQALTDHGLGYGLSEYPHVIPSILTQWEQSPVVKPCVVPTPEDLAIITGGVRAADINETLEKKYSYDWLELTLQASLEVAANVAGFEVGSASISTSFHVRNIQTRVSFVTNLDYHVDFGTAMLKKYQWTDDASALVANYQDLKAQAAQNPSLAPQRDRAAVDLYLRCGDRFINQVGLGAEFNGAYRVNFADTHQMLDFLVEAKARVNKYIHAEESLEKSYDRRFGDSVVEVEVNQVGGDQAHADALRNSLGGDQPTSTGNVRSRCFLSPFDFNNQVDFENQVTMQLERCHKAWALINDYVKNDLFTQLQLPNKFATAKTLNQQQISYFQAGLLDSELTLPEPTKAGLGVLETLFRNLGRLKLLKINATESIDRSAAAATQVHDQAADWGQLGSRLSQLAAASLDPDIATIKAAISQCLTSLMSNDIGAGCANVTLDYSKYNNFFLTWGNP